MPLVTAKARTECGLDDECVGDTFMFPQRWHQQPARTGKNFKLGVWAYGQVAARFAGMWRDSLMERQWAMYQPCAVHLDAKDSAHIFGAPTHYLLVDVACQAAAAPQDFREQDLVVCEHEHGGRAVVIATASPLYFTTAVFNTCKHVHCNVWPDACVGPKPAPLPLSAGRVLVRLVQYTKRAQDNLVSKLVSLPLNSRRKMWKHIQNDLLDNVIRKEQGLPPRTAPPVTRTKRK